MGDSGSMLALGVRLFFSLALVLGLLFLIARFANRRFKGRVGAPIQVVHRQQLSRSSSVAVITVGTRVLVVGSTEHQVTLLTEVEPDEVGLDPDTMLPEVDPAEEAAVPSKANWMAGKNVPETGFAGSLLSPTTWRRTWEQIRPSPRAAAPSASSAPTGTTASTPAEATDDRRAS